MKVIVDCGVVYECVRSRKVRHLDQQHTTSLVFYELGNVIWKNSILIKTYSQKEAFEFLDICEMILDKMNISHSNLYDIYRVAALYHLSFYDASYVCLAQKSELPLVTLDMKLHKKIHSFIPTCSFEDFIQNS